MNGSNILIRLDRERNYSFKRLSRAINLFKSIEAPSCGDQIVFRCRLDPVPASFTATFCFQSM